MKISSYINVKANKMRENDLCPSILNINFKKYKFSYFLLDIIVGLKMFITIVPVAISFAIFSGGSPIQGLISVSIASIVSIFLGGSKYQISSVAWAVSLISLDVFTKYQYKGMLLTSGIIALILTIYGTIQMGNLLKYISKTFLAAIAVYIALIIIITQTQVLLNIPITYSHQVFYGNCVALLSGLKQVDATSLYIYLIFMGSLLFLKLFFKGFGVYAIYTIIWSLIMLCDDCDIFEIPDMLSSLKMMGQSFFQGLNRNNILNISYSFPFSQSVLKDIVLLSFSIALVISCQVCATAGVTKSLTGETKTQTNIELISTGLANFLSVATGGLFVAPDLDITAQNVENKSKSVVTLFAIVIAIGSLLEAKDYIFKYIPAFTMSTVLVYIAFHLLYRYFSLNYLNIKKANSQIFLLILFIAIKFEIVSAIIVGFIVSIMYFSNRMLNIKEASVNTQRGHNSALTELIANKYGYLPNKEISKKLLSKIEIIQFESVLDINLLEYISDTFSTRKVFPSVVIIYFKNIPFFDGYAFEVLKEFVQIASKHHAMVLVTGTNGLLLEHLKRKTKEYNSGNVFGYIIPEFSEAVKQTLYRLRSDKETSRSRIDTLKNSSMPLNA